MTVNALIQTRIDAGVKARAAAVLDRMGLSMSDAVRILMTRIANEGALPIGFTTDPITYDTWFRARVQEALDDPRPPIPHEEVENIMATVKAEALRKAAGNA